MTGICPCGIQKMKHLYCFIVGILLSLPVTAENAVLKKAELRVLDIGNRPSTEVLKIIRMGDGKTKEVMSK